MQYLVLEDIPKGLPKTYPKGWYYKEVKALVKDPLGPYSDIVILGIGFVAGAALTIGASRLLRKPPPIIDGGSDIGVPPERYPGHGGDWEYCPNCGAGPYPPEVFIWPNHCPGCDPRRQTRPIG